MTDSQKILRGLSLSVKNYIKKYNELQFIKPDDLQFAISSRNGRHICCMIDKSCIEDKIVNQPFDAFLQELAADLKDCYNVDMRVHEDKIVLYIISLDEYEIMLQDDLAMVRSLYEEIVSMLEVIEEQVKYDPYLDDDYNEDDAPYYP